jgi:hypothetical protein
VASGLTSVRRRGAHAILIDPIGFEDFLAGAAAALDF